MNAVAQVSAAISAPVLIGVFPLEAFRIDRPATQKFLGIEAEGIRNVHLWSFCIGVRNALAGVGTRHQGNGHVGRAAGGCAGRHCRPVVVTPELVP